MDSQNIAPQESTQISIIERVDLANNVIKKIYALTANAKEMRSKAKMEEQAVKSAKKSRILMRVLSPFISIHIVMVILSMLVSFGLEYKSTLVAIIGFTVFVVGIVIFWCLPWNIKQHEKQAEEYAHLASEIDNDINILISKYSNEIALIPEKYRYPMAIDYLVELFQMGRATTLPIAYDKLEEQIHRWKMEAAMQKALASQMDQAEILKIVKKNAAVSAAANTVSAVANIGNFLS